MEPCFFIYNFTLAIFSLWEKPFRETRFYGIREGSRQQPLPLPLPSGNGTSAAPLSGSVEQDVSQMWTVDLQAVKVCWQADKKR